jgi:hypothetical protein
MTWVSSSGLYPVKIHVAELMLSTFILLSFAISMSA